MKGTKLSYYGIGPKIAWVMLPWMAITIYLSIRYNKSFSFIQNPGILFAATGILTLAAGLSIYFLTLPLLLKGIKETKLITEGAYRLSANPLYASIFLLILPGISLLMNSWLVLTVSVVGYIAFRIYIREEYDQMERVFGESYIRYRNNTPEFFPFRIGDKYKSFK